MSLIYPPTCNHPVTPLMHTIVRTNDVESELVTVETPHMILEADSIQTGATNLGQQYPVC